MATEKRFDSVGNTTTTSGSGSYALGSSIDGLRGIADVLSTSEVAFFRIDDGGVTDRFEIITGTFTSPSTLARTTVHISWVSGVDSAPTALSWPDTATKYIYLIDRAEAETYAEAANNGSDFSNMATLRSNIAAAGDADNNTLSGDNAFTGDVDASAATGFVFPGGTDAWAT
jgi:hypothetical protein